MIKVLASAVPVLVVLTAVGSAAAQGPQSPAPPSAPAAHLGRERRFAVGRGRTARAYFKLGEVGWLRPGIALMARRRKCSLRSA